MQRIVASILTEEMAGTTLLDYLAARFTYHSREEWGRLVSGGRILINGTPASADCVICGGEEMRYLPEPRKEPDVSWNVGKIFEDDDYLVLDKPANLPCHPAGIFFDNTLWAALKEGRLDGIPVIDEFYFVNRLDRETSGIVLIAKNKHAAHARLVGAQKKYHVLVEGNFPETLDANGYLGIDASSQIGKKRCFRFEPFSNAQTVRTIFYKVKEKDGLSLLEATLLTGRTHQIRATLCSLGFPVVGDKLYGVDETIFLRFINGELTDDDKRRLRLPFQALHAFSLSFGKYYFCAPPPEWEKLEIISTAFASCGSSVSCGSSPVT